MEFLGSVGRRVGSIILASSLLLSGLGTPRALAETASPATAPAAGTMDPKATAAEADRLLDEGTTLADQHKYVEAVVPLQRALRLYLQLDNDRKSAEALFALGIVHMLAGNYSQAMNAQELLYLVGRQGNSVELQALSLGFLPILATYVGDFDRATQYAELMVDLGKRTKKPDLVASGVDLLGLIYDIGLGDREKAVQLRMVSVALAQQLKNPSQEAAALIELGTLHLKSGNYAAAIEALQKVFPIVDLKKPEDYDSYTSALVGLGFAQANQGNPSQAEASFQKLLKLAEEKRDVGNQAGAIFGLGVLQTQANHYAEAAKLFDRAAVLHEQEQKEPPKEGIQNFLQAIDYNDLMKTEDLDMTAKLERSRQYLLVQQNQPEAALEASERARARVFISRLSQRLQQPKAQLPPPSIAEIQRIAKAHQATIVEYSIVANPAQVLLNEEEAPSAELYIWVVKPTGEIVFRKSSLSAQHQRQESVIDLVGNARYEIGATRAGVTVQQKPADPDADAETALRQLHQLLIEPIQDALPSDPNARVVMVPQGTLFLVPFAALQDGDGRYLLEKHTLSIAPSIQLLDLTQRQKNPINFATAQALVVGNPKMPEGLDPLPGAEKEAQAIAPLLKTQPLIGAQATKEAVLQKLTTADIVHLATHGILHSPQGTSATLILAATPDDGGLLTDIDLMRLKLKANLVVLSACNTGRGRISGDGVNGLARSLVVAGVPSVVVSLWSVPDGPTAELMTAFYQALKKTPDKAQALRQAMLATQAKHPDPINWAAFTLVGEP